MRLRAGEISSSDKNQIEITAGRFELNAQSAKSGAAQARVALEVLLGVPHPSGECDLTDGLEALCIAAQPVNTNSVGTWRPDVVAAEAALRKAEAGLHSRRPIHKLQLTINAPSKPGPFYGVVTVVSDLKDEPRPHIKTFATIVGGSESTSR